MTTRTRGGSILDLFFTSNPALIDAVDVISGLGDRVDQVGASVTPKTPRPVKSKIFLYSKGFFADIKSELLDFNLYYLDNLRAGTL